MTLFDTYALLENRTTAIDAAVSDMAQSAGSHRGAVFTRPEVVHFMLDLAGYKEDQDLANLRFLEPSFGDGEFLLAAIERLLRSYFAHGGVESNAGDALKNCIVAVELHRATYLSTSARVRAELMSHGLTETQASQLTQAWLRCDDFLLAFIEGRFDFILGNPPYLRQEAIAPVLLAAYRAQYVTIYDRADLYVPFFERSLDLLEAEGELCFICSDRWLRNRYGGPLRRKVADGYHVAAYVDMVDVGAFQDDVTAYPAITLIRRDTGHDTCLTIRPDLDPEYLQTLAPALRGDHTHHAVERVPWAVQGAEPWLLDLGPALAVLRDIEGRFPSLEESGCAVGIGVATGADRVYIGSLETLDVEEDRKLPLILAEDVRGGELRWSGRGIVNPFNDGRLVELTHYPRLHAHFTRHEDAVRARNVAQRNPRSWYRTIDKISPTLLMTPKLLIPDLSGKPVIAYDPGRYYPHHNLYFITSNTWDLLALKTVLRSQVTELFIGAYSVKMRGGTLRFQAQYLRRLRLPRWETVPQVMRAQLLALTDSSDEIALNEAVFALYGLDEHAIAVLTSR